MARDDYFRRRAGEERHLRDLNEAIHPTAAAFENLTTNFSFGSRSTAAIDEFSEKIQKSAENLRTVFDNLCTVGRAAGGQIKETGSEWFNYWRGTHFAKSFGIKAEGDIGVDQFANAIGRFLASRSVSRTADYLIERQREPLQDNFKVDRASQSANSAITAYATTQSITHALIAGITT